MYGRIRGNLLFALAFAALVAAGGAALLVSASGGGGGSAARGGAPVVLRLGYFPNVTHATAIVGVSTGIFSRALGEGVRLETKTFNAGPSAVEALFSGALDATYIGPNPSVNAFVRSGGEAIRVISGATSGGAFLVVKPGIRSAGGLKGKKVASPQLGNTQDVALRNWLAAQGLRTDVAGGGDVSIVTQENAQTLETFRSGTIAGAWIPEPWASRLVLEGGGTILVDERALWPGGRYVTTNLIVRTAFLREHRDIVERLLRGQVEANRYVNDRPEEAKRIVNDGIAAVTGKKLPDPVIDAAWRNLEFTNDPVASSLRAMAAAAVRLGFLRTADLAGIYDLSLLNRALKAAGEPGVSAG